MVAIGAILGIGLVVYGAWRIGSANRPAAAPATKAQAAITQAVVAARPIARGQLLATADLSTVSFYGPSPTGVLTSPQAAVGKVAAVDIQAQQLILTSTLSVDGAGAGLATRVQPGYRAISLDITDEIAVADFVRPGDIVDIEIFLPKSVVAPNATTSADLSEARTLLQNIEVLAVDAQQSAQAVDAAAAKPEQQQQRRGRTMTLAMTPEQVSKFVLARALGRFYLTLRNPNDRSPASGVRAGLGDLRGGAAPRTGATTVRRAAPPRPIEVLVEGRREVIYPGASGR